jgi:hypothetical protein
VKLVFHCGGQENIPAGYSLGRKQDEYTKAKSCSTKLYFLPKKNGIQKMAYIELTVNSEIIT